MDSETGLYYYGARYYDPCLGLWYGVDALTEKSPNIGSYLFCHANPLMRIDIDGNWDVKVHLYKDRSKYGYGIAVVTDNHGNEIFRFKVRAEGARGHNRMKSGADTPLGTYDIPDNPWMSGGDRAAYGPNVRLSMVGVSGEIIDSKRTNIRIHGGRQEYQDENGDWKPVADPKLKKTYGCLRAYDTDIFEFKQVIDNLEDSDMPGVVVIVDDLEENVYPKSNSYIEVDVRYEIPDGTEENSSYDWIPTSVWNWNASISSE